MRPLLLLLGALILPLSACERWLRPATYSFELEECLLAKTCEGYVACRREVADKYKRPFSGRCNGGEE